MAVPVSCLAIYIAMAVEEWEKDHPDLTIKQLLEALETIRYVVTEATIRYANGKSKKDN